MKNKIKLIATDVDGTFVDFGRNDIVSKYNIALANELKKRNIRLVLATGRTIDELSNIHEQLGFITDSVCLNGSIIYNDKKEQLISNTLTEKDLMIIYRLSEKYNIKFILYYENNIGCFCEQKELLNHIRQGNIKHLNKDFFSDDFYMNAEKVDISNIKKLPFKAETMFTDLSIQQQVRNELSVCDDMLAFSSLNHNIEINNINSNKGKALKELCEIYQIKDDEVLCFGDGENDIPMLENYKNSYAMPASPQHVKEKARHVCLDNADECIYRTVMQYL